MVECIEADRDRSSSPAAARVTVHFSSVCDRFGPYDTTFSLAAPKELKDSKLSAACSLHAASGSTSSSTSSLRRRRLMEIAEEEEEEQRAAKRQSVVKEEDRPGSSDGVAGPPSSSPSHQGPPPPSLTLNSSLADSVFATTADAPSFVGVRPPSPAKSLDAARHTPYGYSSYSSYAKPRVKLGPRPSLDIGGRPRTSSGTNNYRPISSIPAGFKLFAKGAKKGGARTSDDSRPIKEEDSAAAFLIPSIPIPEDPPDSPGIIRPHTSGGRPTTSSGLSTKSAVPSVGAAARKNAMTPEKARLKKAMQLREKRKKMSLPPGAAVVPVVDVVEVSFTPEETILESTGREDEPMDQADLLAGGERDLENRSSISKADSGIDVRSSMTVDHSSVDTQSDSHPASPLAMSSEIGDSTTASSLSESTDETIQAHHEDKIHGVDAALDVFKPPAAQHVEDVGAEGLSEITGASDDFSEHASEDDDDDAPVGDRGNFGCGPTAAVE